jgi:hypothetical protein
VVVVALTAVTAVARHRCHRAALRRRCCCRASLTIVVIALADAHGGCTVDQSHGDLAVVCRRFELCFDFVAVATSRPGSRLAGRTATMVRVRARPRDVDLTADRTERRGARRRARCRRRTWWEARRMWTRRGLSSMARVVVGAVLTSGGARVVTHTAASPSLIGVDVGESCQSVVVVATASRRSRLRPSPRPHHPTLRPRSAPPARW